MSYPTPSLALVSFGIWEALFIFGVVVLLFGARKLPMLARGLGTGIRNFKGELHAPPDDGEEDEDEPLG